MSDFKVGIIGIGHVGAHVLYTLALQGISDDFVIVDLEDNEKKAIAERQDVLDSTEFLPHRVNIKIGKIEDLKDTDLIINAVGNIIALKGTNTRLSEMEFNMNAIQSYATKLKESGFKGILVNISNPCDVITKWLAEFLNLPQGHVLGTGTGLDTARLKLRLQEKTGVSTHSITAFMLGEHGSQQIAPWSQVSFNGLLRDKIAENDEAFKFDRDAVEKDAREGGWITYNGKFCTEYAIALTAARLARIIKYDEKEIIPVSYELNGEYGESGLFAGVPALVGRNGVERVIELELTDEEKVKFHSCCDGIRANIEESKKFLK